MPEWDVRRCGCSQRCGNGASCPNGRWIRARLDLLVEGGPGGPVRYADVRVGHPLAPSHVRAAAAQDGATARKGEREKFLRYGPAVIPLCCETFGRWGLSALRWWRELSKFVAEADPDLASRGRWAQAGLLSRWWAETSVALQRANADTAFAASEGDGLASGADSTGGAEGPAPFEFLLPPAPGA